MFMKYILTMPYKHRMFLKKKNKKKSNKKNATLTRELNGKCVCVLDRRGPRPSVFEMILHTVVKFWTTRLAFSSLGLSQLLGSKTTFCRISGHRVFPTWLWSSSGYFCVSCPYSLRLFRRDLRLPSPSLLTATSRLLYPPVARSASSRPWGKMRPWRLNTRLDIFVFYLTTSIQK